MRYFNLIFIYNDRRVKWVGRNMISSSPNIPHITLQDIDIFASFYGPYT